jgi:hypothetical protein
MQRVLTLLDKWCDRLFDQGYLPVDYNGVDFNSLTKDEQGRQCHYDCAVFGTKLRTMRMMKINDILHVGSLLGMMAKLDLLEDDDIVSINNAMFHFGQSGPKRIPSSAANPSAQH